MGYFYPAKDHAQGAYTLNEEKEAIAYAATICFSCSDFAIKQINGKDEFYISEKRHLDILEQSRLSLTIFYKKTMINHWHHISPLRMSLYLSLQLKYMIFHKSPCKSFIRWLPCKFPAYCKYHKKQGERLLQEKTWSMLSYLLNLKSDASLEMKICPYSTTNCINLKSFLQNVTCSFDHQNFHLGETIPRWPGLQYLVQSVVSSGQITRRPGLTVEPSPSREDITQSTKKWGQ